jgi:catechol 2,3-dioxygenase-like lactoylglutathione lyase family enzyme
MTFEEFAQRLAERAQRVLPFKEVTVLAANRFMDIGDTPRSGDPSEGMRHVVAALRVVRDPFNFGRLLLYAGYLVENGAPARDVALVVAEQLGDYVVDAAMAVEGTTRRDLMEVATDVSTINPRAASAILVVDAAIPGAMTLLVREREALRIARKDPDLLRNSQTLATFAKVAYFLVELLESSDAERLIVILPTRKLGFEVVADFVRNGFHLFTLLEAALLGDLIEGSPVPVAEAAIARGDLALDEKREFRARFDYFNWSAWGQAGFVADAPTRWIWGELPLRFLPRVDGSPIVLMEDPRYVRTWDGSLISRVHPDVRSRVTVSSILSQSDVGQWLDRLGSAPSAVRAQMKYAGVKLEA